MRKQYHEKRFSDFRELINHSASTHGKRTAFVIKDRDGTKHEITYAIFREHYYEMCERFLDAGLGGKHIGIIGKNCYQWVLYYVAAATVGVAVPLDKELPLDELQHIMEVASCDAIAMADDLVEKLQPVLDRKVAIYRFSEVLPSLQAIRDVPRERVDAIKIPRDEMQILVFTSGTTGSSRGVCLSQFAILSNIHSTVSAVKIEPKDVTLSILPLHHTYECTLNCLLPLSRGSKITYLDGLTKVLKNLVEYSPTVLVVVPELLKVVHRRIRISIKKGVPEKYRSYFEDYDLATALSKIPFFLRFIIRRKVKKTLGGKIRLFIVGAADLDTTLVEDFLALGIRTLQGYGLTECSPLLAGNNDFYFNPRSTGVAMPGVSLKIDDPNEEGVGEILAKGDNIMLGYYQDPEATERVFRDGWFCTGDLGRMDPDGALYIQGRLKNVIVMANGKNTYPEELENRLAAYEEVQDVLVLGAKQLGGISIKARIYPNLEFLERVHGRIPSKEDIKQAIDKIVQTVNEQIQGYKRISIVDILEQPLEKTTTRKIRRFGENVAG